MNTNTDLIQIKGLRDGLLVTLGAGEWGELQNMLFAQIDERSSFFQGARLALDLGDQILRVAEMSKLRDELSERDISLWAVVSDSPKTVQTAQLLGLATRISKHRIDNSPRKINDDADSDEAALWLPRTLRSGTRIEHHGHVIVMGDVNPGAEIIAEGSVIIWGRLRGSVHAGATPRRDGSLQNEAAFVCALEMKPTRLQIASEIATMPKGKNVKGPLKISLKDNQFLIEPWHEK